MSLKNKIQPVPSINLVDPSGIQADYSELIQESIFRIIRIDEPQVGKWNYEIRGDALFVYDITNPYITEPYYSIYSNGAEVPLKIKISGLFEENTEINSTDFEVYCDIKDPRGEVVENLKLTDDGKNMDENANDGIFSGIYTELEEFEQKASNEIAPYLLAVIIAASAFAVAAIILMVYFLYIRPKRRGF